MGEVQYIAPRRELKTYPMWVSVDLAHKIDICAAAKLWRTDNGHVHADFKFWLPEGRLERCSLQHGRTLPKWAEMDKLILTDGDVIDHAQIKSDLLEWIGGKTSENWDLTRGSMIQFSTAHWLKKGTTAGGGFRRRFRNLSRGHGRKRNHWSMRAFPSQQSSGHELDDV